MRFRGDPEQTLADHIAAQDPRPEARRQSRGEGRLAAAAKPADRDKPAGSRPQRVRGEIKVTSCFGSQFWLHLGPRPLSPSP